MNAYTIHVNGLAYAGVDLDGDEPAEPGLGNGFHYYNSGQGQDRLLFGGEPCVLYEIGRAHV